MIGALGAGASMLARLPWQAYALVLCAVVLWRASDLAYERGRAVCEAGNRAAAVEERMRQAAANRLALQTGAEIVTVLTDENDRLTSILMEIEDEVRDLPDGDACGLGADGMRLLDRVGGAAGPGRAAGGPHP